MRILVLGGAGYIGSHTVYELIDAGYEVVIIDNLLTGFKEAIHPEAKFYEGDIRDKKFLDEVFSKEKIDGIVAAIRALDRCIRQEGKSGSVYDDRGILIL